MNKIVNTSANLRRPILTLALTALIALAALAAPVQVSAQTGCQQWNVSEGWYSLHPRFRVIFNLQQQGTRLNGVAAYTSIEEPSVWTVFSASGSGPISGTIRGNKIEISTQWGGVYVGTIDNTGRIDGYTYDKRDSTSRATWYSDRRMNCLVTAAPKPPVSPTPIPSDASQRGGGGAAAIRGAIPSAPSVAAQVPAPAPVPTPPRVGKSCNAGFVHRLASPADLVCVAAQSQTRVVAENRSAGTRRQPGGGAYGPNTCRAGFVWREAFAGDVVCVTPAERGLVAEENRLAASHARER